MDKLMSQHADLVHNPSDTVRRRGQVRFGSVEWGANRDLCRSVGIETVPTTRIYVGGSLVEEITGGSKDFGRIQEMIEYLLQDDKSSQLEDDLELTLDRGTVLMSELLPTEDVVPVVVLPTD